MYFRNILVLLIIMIFSSGCNSTTEIINETNVSNNEAIYTVTTIFDMTMDDFKKFIKDGEYPLQIKLKRYDTLYEGSVVLKILGEKKISRNCTSERCFIIEVKGELGPVESIIFNTLEITDSFIKGWYCRTGPTIDTGCLPFEAVRNN